VVVITLHVRHWLLSTCSKKCLQNTSVLGKEAVRWGDVEGCCRSGGRPCLFWTNHTVCGRRHMGPGWPLREMRSLDALGSPSFLMDIWTFSRARWTFLARGKVIFSFFWGHPYRTRDWSILKFFVTWPSRIALCQSSTESANDVITSEISRDLCGPMHWKNKHFFYAQCRLSVQVGYVTWNCRQWIDRSISTRDVVLSCFIQWRAGIGGGHVKFVVNLLAISWRRLYLSHPRRMIKIAYILCFPLSFARSILFQRCWRTRRRFCCQKICKTSVVKERRKSPLTVISLNNGEEKFMGLASVFMTEAVMIYHTCACQINAWQATGNKLDSFLIVKVTWHSHSLVLVKGFVHTLIDEDLNWRRDVGLELFGQTHL
jgi:hypothetical protein